ncbi:Pentatricopeptide repeat-containing protein [Camellia lanceoleosa]|uniref:Pentatricopeptide repeat-containing protein n=1 Tax=Camellia lanceoleosa TaxID=1840588 RepID=A0ACC0GE35_9ERIC|nr:Pentatricopeptide repeat-containing protein [Camellia lanceoleosa]
MGSSRIVWSITAMMLQTDKESLPDDESYDLVIGMLLLTDQIDVALKYIDLTLKSGYILSINVFTECVRNCVNKGRLDTLALVIERCKKMDQNKALCPPRNLCNCIANVAMEEDSSEMQKKPILLSVDEGLVVFVLGTTGRMYNAKLLDGSWAILKRALHQKKVPNPESYLAKIYTHASLGNLQKAFSTLHEFETTYRNFTKEAEEDLLFPFTSLYPLVMACSKDGFVTLDSVYYQLENLSQADPPYKSIAALNCIILGCANTWDVDRAYQTFETIDGAFGLIPNIHSYNALKCAFVKLNMTSEASSVFDHLINKGVKPNSTTCSLFVNTHLVK